MSDERELFIPKATDPAATWGEFPPEDERLPVSAEVMALLETDFPEAAQLFQVDPMWLENYRYPQRFLFGFDGSRDGDVSVFQVDAANQRIWALPEPRNELEGDIRADERKLVCAQEGHNEVETTELGSPGHDYRCFRCGHSWNRTQTRALHVPRAAVPNPLGRIMSGLICPDPKFVFEEDRNWWVGVHRVWAPCVGSRAG
jgi:hypothetical protein